MPRRKKSATIFEGRIEKEDAEPGFKPEKEEFAEPEEHTEPHEEREMALHMGEEGVDVYTEEGREELTEDEGEIQPWEEGFSKGASGPGSQGVCEHCGKPLGDREEEVIERRIDDEIKLFCSEACASKCERKHKKS